MLIDVNASFGGREAIQHFGVETMLEQISRIPCSLAFVHCRQGMTDHALANDQTLALCREYRWLAPVGVIHPRDAFTWQGEVKRCLAAGARLFRLYPDQGNWPVDSVFLDLIVERLAGTGSGLLIDATTPGLPSHVAARTAEMGIPIIFSEVRYYPLGEVLPLMARYSHLYVETSRLTSPEAIESCVNAVGPSRLLFGSGTARYPAWVAWQVLERAAITADERAAIAWRNAAELLQLASMPDEQVVPQAADLKRRAMPIIDVHLHDRLPGAPIKPYTAAEFEEQLTACGIDQGVCSSATAILYDLERGNDEVAELLKQLPRVHGYVVVDPRYYEESVRQLGRLEHNPRFVGVKIHAAYAKTPTSAPEMRRLVQVIAAYRRPLLIHNLGEDWPEALVGLANEHPDLPIIAAHGGYGDGPQPTHDAALRIAPANNVFLEFCSTYLTSGAIRRGIDATGPSRVLFGSDFPLIAQPYMLANYEDVGLSPLEIEEVFYRNARRLFWSLESVADA